MAVEFSTGQNVYRVEVIESDCDHQGSFKSFVDCFNDELEKITGQDEVILCIDSMSSGEPHRDVFNYHPQKGIESLREVFEEYYKDGIGRELKPNTTEQ
jgi:hypothetical protein